MKEYCKELLRRIARKILANELRDLIYIQQSDKTILQHKIDTLEKRLAITPTRIPMIRIPAEQFAQFRRQLPDNVIASTSTELQAAALVGQQRVLDLMQKEFVIA